MVPDVVLLTRGLGESDGRLYRLCRTGRRPREYIYFHYSHK